VSRLRVALVQLDAGRDVAANLDRAVALVRRAGEALAGRPGLIALPEVFLYRGPAAGFRESATELPGALTEPFSELARDLRAWLLLGSLAERSADPERPYNTSILLDPHGAIAARYRKCHLFDVTIDGGPSDHESARTMPGQEAVVAELAAAAEGADVRLGLSVCFDLRFPELYRDLTVAGAEVLAVPSSFTEATGCDHWEVLLRARAIENGAFVIAPAQCGSSGGILTHGRSMAIDPWGIVLAQAPDGPGVVVAELDLDRVAAVRRQIPSQPG
jgi:predicted amidohydrolase